MNATSAPIRSRRQQRFSQTIRDAMGTELTVDQELRVCFAAERRPPAGLDLLFSPLWPLVVLATGGRYFIAVTDRRFFLLAAPLRNGRVRKVLLSEPLKDLKLETYRQVVVDDVLELKRKSDGFTMKLRVHRSLRAEVDTLMEMLRAAQSPGG